MNARGERMGRLERRVTGALLIGLLSAVMGTHALAEEPRSLDPETAHEWVREGKLELVDVRRPSEWAETGIPEDAHPLTLHGPRGLEGLLDQIETLTRGDRSTPVGLICHSGTRSAHVRKALEERGYSAVHDVSAGVVGTYLTPGWVDRGLPVETYEPEKPPSPGVVPDS
ncbi:MAG: rhodanese-like domain-containing protein [bacterium]